MSATYTDPIRCQGEDCDATVSSHKWGKIKAADWYFTKDGKGYCPLHLPAWLVERRGRKGAQ